MESAGKSKKWLWIGVAAAVVVVAVACVLVFVVFHDDVFGGGSAPEQVVQEMFDALSAKDVDGYLALMDPQGLAELAAAGTDAAAAKAMLTEQMSYDSMAFTGIKLQSKVSDDGQTATVTVTEGKLTVVESGEPTIQDVKDNDEPVEYLLVLRDGKWYLDASSL